MSDDLFVGLDGRRHRWDDTQRPTGNRVPVDALGWPEDESPARRDIAFAETIRVKEFFGLVQ